MVRIEPYLQHIPEIEDRIRRLQPDALVIGLGPSAHLLPWIDQTLLEKPRRFGVHDVFRIVPVDDLIIMDTPHNWLNEDGERFKTIVASRPKRWWFYPTAWDNPKMPGTLYWKQHLPKCVLPSCTVFEWENFEPGRMPVKMVDGHPVQDKDGFNLSSKNPPTSCLSPVGATTLAWHLGCRRIGVIGMDCTSDHHPSKAHIPMVTMVMRAIRKQADYLGGTIWNLSPFSQIRKFDPPTKPNDSGARSEESQQPNAGTGPQQSMDEDTVSSR